MYTLQNCFLDIGAISTHTFDVVFLHPDKEAIKFGEHCFQAS